MKKVCYLMLTLMFISILTGCTNTQDSLKFVQKETPQHNMYCVDYEVNLGNKVESATVVAELWQDGTCTESSPVTTINAETKELHLSLSLDDFDETNEYRGITVQVDMETNADAALTHFELPQTVSGYTFSDYDDNETLEANAGADVILAALAFDMGAGVQDVDCRSLAENPDNVSSYPCLLIVRSSFTPAEP